MSALEGSSNFNFNGDNPSKKIGKPNGYNDSRRSGGPHGKRNSSNRQASGGFDNKNDKNAFGMNIKQEKGFSQERKRTNYKKGHKHNDSSNRPNRNNTPIFKAEEGNKDLNGTKFGSRPVSMSSYSQAELASAGTLFNNPEALGLQKSNRPKSQRARPKYMFNQPRVLAPVAFVQDLSDKQNQEKMLQMEKENEGKDYQGLYEEFQKMRESERKQMEGLGLVDAENISKDLDDAIVFRGSCLDMCPIFERVRRALENNVKSFEKDPVTNKISRERAVKAFSRPAAGQPPPLPSEVRPPHILKSTLDYLVNNIVPQLPAAHSFLWDRTRSIRQDFTYQNYFGPEAIDCNERIVRLHLLSLHIMAGSNMEYSQQQELEQFNKALQTLVEIYQDVRNHGGNAPNEAEFRAYHLLSHLRDPELEREIQNIPDDIFQDSKIQLALRLRNIISQNNIVERSHSNTVGALNLFSEFFKMVFSDEVPVLFACLLETHFNELRFHALKSMARCYHTKGKAYSAEALRSILGFDNLEGLTKFVSYYEIDIINENGEILVDLFNKEKLEAKYKLNSYHDKPKLAQPCSQKIDLKLRSIDLKAIINSGKNNDNLNLKQQKDIQTLRQKLLSKHKGKNNAESNAAVPQSGNNFPTQVNQIDKPSLNSTVESQPTSFGGIVPSVNTPNDIGIEKKPAPSFKSSFSLNAFNSSQIPIEKDNFAPKASSNSNTPSNFGSSSLPITNGLGFQTKGPSTPVLDFNKPANKAKVDLDSFKPKQEEKPIYNSLISSAPPLTSVSDRKADIVPQVHAKKKLSDSPYFSQALSHILKEMLDSSINTELKEILPKLIDRERVAQERASLIDIISGDLYEAFTSELTYLITLNAKADFVYSSHVKKRVVTKIKSIASDLALKHKDRQKKLDELNLVSFQAPLKRVLSSSSSASSVSSPRKKHHARKTADADKELYQKQEEVRKLWEPIDLRGFTHQCSSNFKMKFESKELELRFLLIVEDWSRSFSKWLNTKLSLNVNHDNSTYEHIEKTDKLVLNLSSLPNDNYSCKDYFANTSFILFECGIFAESSDTNSFEEKFQRDERVLKKIIDLSSRFSYYKVHIIVVFWNLSQTTFSNEDIFKHLKLEEHSKNEVISDIVLCDMSKKNADVNKSLVNAFNILSKNFKGELTARGSRKKMKIKSLEREQARQKTAANSKVVSNAMFAQQEKDSLERARLASKYSYLANHVSQANISRASNLSANSTSFVTANHRTNVSNVSTRDNSFSDLINLRTTMGNTTTINNASILTGFGNGVLEQSTPFGSPKSKSFARPNSRNIPRTLDQLRELTASVKARYSKRQS